MNPSTTAREHCSFSSTSVSIGVTSNGTDIQHQPSHKHKTKRRSSSPCRRSLTTAGASRVTGKETGVRTMVQLQVVLRVPTPGLPHVQITNGNQQGTLTLPTLPPTHTSSLVRVTTHHAPHIMCLIPPTTAFLPPPVLPPCPSFYTRGSPAPAYPFTCPNPGAACPRPSCPRSCSRASPRPSPLPWPLPSPRPAPHRCPRSR